MADVFFTADTHFGHNAMITKQWRPFDSVEQMNETLVDNWNRVVRKQDQVWHLGDVAMGSRQDFFENILPRLNGEIHLVAGNHDSCWSGNRDAHRRQAEWLSAGIASVQAFARRKILGHQFMLSHFPYFGDHTAENRYDDYRLKFMGLPLLHGHVHDVWRVHGPQINVGVDVWDWSPVSLSQLEEVVVNELALAA